jgi:phage baseplate assembly protein W
MSALATLGRGWPFDAVPGPGSTRLEWVEGREKVRQAIRIILETEPGERIMRPTFGAGLRRHLMEPNTVALRTLVERDVEQALRTWEPRIELTSVEVTPGAEPEILEIAIAYVHVRTAQPDTLVHTLRLS